MSVVTRRDCLSRELLARRRLRSGLANSRFRSQNRPVIATHVAKPPPTGAPTPQPIRARFVAASATSGLPGRFALPVLPLGRQ